MVLTRVGILGGTFDPVHQGHLDIAGRAMDEAGLDRIIFIPAAQPRLKSAEPTASSEHRTEMLRLAVDGRCGFEVSEIELRRSGPTRSVETLEELCVELGSAAEMYFILGLDVLARFHEWVEPQRVVDLARLLAVNRPGYSSFDWESFYDRNPYARGRVDCIDSTAIDISASELRGRLAAGVPVGGLLPESVERYIRANGLYVGNAAEISGT